MLKKKNVTKRNESRASQTNAPSKKTKDMINRFLSEEYANQEIKHDLTLQEKDLSEIPDGTLIILNEDAMIRVEDDKKIFYTEIVDLLPLMKLYSGKILFALDFCGWLESFEEKLLLLNNNPDEVDLKFPSEDKLEISLIMKCKTVREGIELMDNIREALNDEHEDRIKEIANKYFPGRPLEMGK